MEYSSALMPFLANPKLGNMGDWQGRHNEAVVRPRGFEIGIITMLQGWVTYAMQHKGEYGDVIGNDGVLGDEWAAIGKGLLGLLNGQLGRLDGGTLDTAIRDIMRQHGVEAE